MSRQPQATPTIVPTPGPSPTPTPSLPLLPPARELPGRLLFVADANIWLLERGRTIRLTPDRISRQPSWSHDGRKIAHSKLSTSGSDLWIMDADGSNSQQLTDNDSRDDPQQRNALHPIWWPDDSRLIYLSEEGSEDMQLWELFIADRRRLRLLPPAGDRSGGLDWPKLAPDGRTLAVSSFQPGRGPAGRPQVWLYTLPSGGWRQLTALPEGAYDPDWSPDGQRLAFVARSAGRHDVWVMRADGSGLRQVTQAGTCRAPTWSPDGRWLAYLSAQTGTFELWATRAPEDPDQTTTQPAQPAASAFQQITRGALIDATSGIAWTG